MSDEDRHPKTTGQTSPVEIGDSALAASVASVTAALDKVTPCCKPGNWVNMAAIGEALDSFEKHGLVATAHQEGQAWVLQMVKLPPGQ